MKRCSLLRSVCSCLVITVFAGMTMASGSSSSTKETGSVTINGNKETEATTTKTEDKAEYEITKTTFVHYTNSIKKEEYSGIVEIKNIGGTYIYLDDCTFDFEDDEGHLLQSDKMISKGPDVIAPGEYGYFFNSGYIDDGVSMDKGINLVPNFTVEIAKKGKDALIDYEISDLDLRDGDYGGLKVTGRVTNKTSEETNSIDVKIIAVFKDSNGEILDIGYTYAEAMAAGGKTSFEISTILGNEKVKTEDVAEYKIYARGTSYNW